MRITTYSRDVKRDSTIGYEGYMVIGADTNLNKRWDFDMNTDKECLPLKMTCPKRPLSAYSNELERLISLSKSDLFDDAGRVSIQHIFVDSYAEIVRGNRPGWYISAFRVFVGGIELFFTGPKDEGHGFSWIIGNDLRLRFEAPRTRLGFTPTYDISIRVDGKGNSEKTLVTEDLGYVIFENELKLIDPEKQGDNIFHDGNQYITVTEYAGI